MGADAIVVAAGSSTRMGGPDKLAHEIGGRPLLAWTLEALAAVDSVERIVVVVAPERIAAVRDADWLARPVVAVVEGGARRHESVAVGLATLEALDPAGASGSDTDGRVVLVHDGARPLASPALVAAVLAAAAEHGAAIPVLPVAETVKRIDGDRVVATVDRTSLATAQTPQGIRRALLHDAFVRFPPSGADTWTDEAALLEACRIAVHAVPGEATNFKVTLPADLGRAEAALLGAAPAAAARVGFGTDSHPFGPGRPLALGGLEIDGAFRLHGHSDGDVALHAVADALLGAAGLGDLGRHFPADASTPRDIASGALLTEIVARVAAAGYRPAGVDLTIVGARPRLAPLLDSMGDAIASVLDLPRDRVNVKASTGNLDGMEGAGRGIAAHAVATLASRT